jgi:hypothetical protein
MQSAPRACGRARSALAGRRVAARIVVAIAIERSHRDDPDVHSAFRRRSIVTSVRDENGSDTDIDLALCAHVLCKGIRMVKHCYVRDK